MSNALVKVKEQHLQQVWSERNALNRLKALDALYTKDSVLYEVGEIINGHEKINDKIGAIRAHIPDDFVFSSLRPVVINNNVGRLSWGLGPKGKPPVSTGTDIAIFENEKIKFLYVFLDE